jgi:uncharacterized protein
VILADTSFWLATLIARHPFQRVAREWFDRQPNDHSILFCRMTQLSLLRLLTTKSVMDPYGDPALTNSQALALFGNMRSDPRTGMAVEPGKIEQQWHDFANLKSCSPKLWMDAYLAAFAVSGGHKLVTTDRAFAQFKSLEVIILAN